MVRIFNGHLFIRACRVSNQNPFNSVKCAKIAHYAKAVLEVRYVPQLIVDEENTLVNVELLRLPYNPKNCCH